MHAPSRNLMASGVVGAMLAIAVAAVAPAIDITLQYDASQPGAVMPEFDPNGTQLLTIANYVATFYEDVFEDPGHSPIVTFWYADLTDGLLGDHDNVTNDADGREIAGNIKIDTQNAAGVPRNFFFDPTPATNSEFTMAQMFWRDLSVTNRADWYIAGSGMPQTFETSFTGTAPAGSPAVNATDMLSLVFHEMGHALGMSAGIPLAVNETNDGDYDFNPAFLFGGTLAADNRDQVSDSVGHLDDPSNMMYPSLTTPGGGSSAGVRKLPSHADLFAMAAGHNYAMLDVPRREFYNDNGDWNTDGNWSGNNTPDREDDVFVRDGAIAILSAFSAAASLRVLEGGSVSTQDHTLLVERSTTVAGDPGNESQITISAAGQLDSDMLLIDSDGRVDLESTALLECENITIADDGELHGDGTVHLNSEAGELVSAGLIRAANDGELVFTSRNNLALKLNGKVEVIDGDIRLRTGMNAPLSGTMTVGPGRRATLEQGGVVGAGGLVLLQGTAAEPATVSGMPLSVHVNGVIRADGVGVIENILHLATGAILETRTGDANSELRLTGTTLFQGGKILGDGRARQIGNAIIEQDTEISIDTYDMDGISGATLITIKPHRTLEILSNHIDTTAENDFDGTLEVNSGTLDIAPAWRLHGALDLNGSETASAVLRGAGGVTVSDGGEINITGPAEVDTAVQLDNGTLSSDGDAELSGPTTLGNEGRIDTTGRLRLSGNTTLHGHLQTLTSTTKVHVAGRGPNLVSKSATIDGPGSLTIDNGAHMYLETGSTLNLDVENAGRLEVGFLTADVGPDVTAAGSATMRGHFSQLNGGTFGVELGGQATAEQFDVLRINGTARLGGTLAVELIDAFEPIIGDMFQILTADSVTGTFDSLVATDAANRWGLDISVLYSTTDAAVRIDDLFLLGDYNQDGAVDAADYALWRDTLGETGVDLLADGNRDGTIDAADFDVWRAHFGQNVGGVAPIPNGQSIQAAAVPEPASLIMPLIGSMYAFAGRRRGYLHTVT
jgi:hypothetical protein